MRSMQCECECECGLQPHCWNRVEGLFGVVYGSGVRGCVDRLENVVEVRKTNVNARFGGIYDSRNVKRLVWMMFSARSESRSSITQEMLISLAPTGKNEPYVSIASF